MSEILKIETILGYVANDNPLRASRDGKAFEEMLPAPAWTEQKVKRSATVRDTVTEMKRLINGYDWQTRKLAKQLKDKDLYSTCKNIWDFLYTHIKYKEDDEGQEQLRTPSRSFAQRLSRGIDCDDFSIFGGCILHMLNIPFYIRIARYEGKDYFQHVYLVVPKSNNNYIVIDAVLDQYDSEKKPIETKDFLVMNTNNLNGVDISVLGGIEDDTTNEISGILSGADFRAVEGFGDTATKEQELEAIRNHLIRTRNSIAQRPDLIKSITHPDNMLSMIDYALKYWDTDKRETALNVLIEAEEKINNSEGVQGVLEDVELLFGLNASGSYDVLGKLKSPVKFFTQVKQAVNNVGQGIKSAVQSVVKYNPVTVGIRGAVLLALKLNILKISSKLKWGYLTEAEAKSGGFDLEEWGKLKKQLVIAEKLFVDTLQGQADHFKNAILNGRAGNLSGIDLGLGVVVAAAAGASTAAAMPFLIKLEEFLKNVDFKKLIARVDAKRLARDEKEAETNTLPANRDGSSIPENENTPSVDANSFDEGYGTNSRTASKTQETSKDSGTTEQSFLDKAIAWVKENPIPTAAGTALAGFLLYQVFKPKKKNALSGARGKGKKKKGKAKANPPQVITGTKKKKTKAKTKAKAKPKRKSKSREVRL